MPPSPMSTAPPTSVNAATADTKMDYPGPQDYDAARRFTQESKLRPYLAAKRPESHFDRVDTTSLKEVLQYLKSIISQEHLYDAKNAAVVICDKALESALDVRALHLSEIRYIIRTSLYYYLLLLLLSICFVSFSLNTCSGHRLIRVPCGTEMAYYPMSSVFTGNTLHGLLLSLVHDDFYYNHTTISSKLYFCGEHLVKC